MTETTISQTMNFNTDLKIVKKECFDADMMEIILRDKRFSKRDLGNLSRYKKGRTHSNIVEVVYHYGRGCEKHKLGRLYPHSGQGLQAFPRDIRNPLLEKNYWDCDMENAHYNFMVKLSTEWGLRNDAIKHYIAKRDECLEKVSSNRGVAKTAFLKVAYGGDVKLYSEFANDDGIEPDGDISIIEAVKAEVTPLVNYVWLNFKQYHSLVKSKKNPLFSLFALILQTEECKCLLAMDAYLKTQNRSMEIFIHDGGEVRKLENETKFPEHLLRGMEKSILTATGHTVKVVVKPIKHFLLENTPEVDKKTIITDDASACVAFYKKYGASVVRAIDGWYANMPNTNFWVMGDGYIKQLIIDANFKKNTEFGLLSYSTNHTGMNNIFKMLECCYNLYPLNENFIDEINQKTKGRIYFEDKYWDLIKRCWCDITADAIPLIYIKRPAPVKAFEEITDADIEDFYNKVFNMFRTSGDREMYLRAIARAAGGFIEDKRWNILKGMRNCGKGILQEQNKASIGEYISFIDPPMSKSFNSGDASEMRWLLTANCHLKRISFTNEVKGLAGKNKLTFDGNIIKKVIASGGDLIPTRMHHKGEIFVKNNTTTFMSLNEIPVCDPVDALDNMILFDMPYKFVEKEMVKDDIMYRESNPNLKSEIVTNELWRDTYLYLLTKYFKNEPTKISDMSFENKIECEEIASASTITNPIQLLNKYTKQDTEADAEGWVSTDDLRRILKPAKMSDQKMGRFLTERGYIRRKKTLKTKDLNGDDVTKQHQGYAGLSLRKTKDDDEDEC